MAKEHEDSATSRGPLVVRLCNWVGEVVLSVPALRRLENAGYELHLVGKGWAPGLLEGTGWPVLVRRHGLRAATGQLRELKRRLTHGPARAIPAILLTKSLSSAIEARAGGFDPYGYARDGRSILLREAYPFARFVHAAHAYWDVVSRFLREDAPYPEAVDLEPGPAARERAATLLARHGLAAGSYVLLCPFSGADDREGRKVWPHYAQLGRELTAASVPVVVCPGPGEETAAAATLPGAVCLTGTDLATYGALLANSRCVVANDTGPGHLAAAVGARLIAIYGPQSVSAWAPLGHRVELLLDTDGWPDVARIRAAIGA
jgi:heptosyltransferase-2